MHNMKSLFKQNKNFTRCSTTPQNMRVEAHLNHINLKISKTVSSVYPFELRSTEHSPLDFICYKYYSINWIYESILLLFLYYTVHLYMAF